MHLGTALLLLELVLVLVVEVALVFTTAMTLQGIGTVEGGGAAAETTDGVQERGVKDVEDFKGANEIIEKIERTLREQSIRRSDNHILRSSSSVDSPLTDPTGSLLAAPAAAHSSSATETKTPRTTHLKAPPSLSPSASAHRTNVHAPKYMLDLYDKFSKDKYSHPMANIVRSFMNIDEEAIDADTTGVAAETGLLSNSSSSRVHRLLFNVTSIGRDEEIYLAELRLFTLVEADRQLYDGINRRVTVSEVIDPTSITTSSRPSEPTTEGGDRRLELIDSKEIYGRHSGWETITITEAVKRWVKQRPQGDTHMLEVRIGTVGRLKGEGSSNSNSLRDAIHLPSPGPFPPLPMIDINSRPNNENEPLLLVFSNDRRRNAYESNELNEVIYDDQDETVGRDIHPNESSDLDYAYYDEEVVYEYEDDNAANNNAADERRKKRAAPSSSSAAPSSPSSSSAAAASSAVESRIRTGRASSRVSREAAEKWDVLSPADEIDYPMEIARRLRMARMNETRSTEEEDDDDDDEEEEEEEEEDDVETGGKRFRSEGRGNGGRRSYERKRVRRSGKRKLRRNGCHRVPLYVNFEDINWHNWILKPSGYPAYECTGRCYFPLDDRLTPTKHAIIQTMLNAHYPKKASETCCVPTKLEPISILYVDDQGIVTFKYKYDGMVVTECGCR